MMKEETIKDLLLNSLKIITSDSFNQEIIQQLNLSKKKEKLILFDEKSIIKIFTIVALFILIVSSNILEKLTPTSIIIGLFICISPLYFMIFNKIYQSTIQ
jgi:hypothetical protein